MKTCENYITDRREHILLSEQQFGLFEGLTIDEIKTLYPLEYAHFEKCIAHEGLFLHVFIMISAVSLVLL